MNKEEALDILETFKVEGWGDYEKVDEALQVVFQTIKQQDSEIRRLKVMERVYEGMKKSL